MANILVQDLEKDPKDVYWEEFITLCPEHLSEINRYTKTFKAKKRSFAACQHCEMEAEMELQRRIDAFPGGEIFDIDPSLRYV